MMEENSTSDLSKMKLTSETDEVVRDLIKPEALHEQDESDGPRDPTTQDRGDISLEPTNDDINAETVRKPIVVELSDSSSTSSSGLS